MKKVISVALLSLSVTCSALIGVGQSAAEPSRPKATPERKNQNAGTVSALTTNAAPNGSNDSVGRTELPTTTATNSGLDAQQRYNAAMALSEAGRLDEAIDAFKQLLQLKPEDAQTHFSLGMTYSKSKAYKDAFESFKKAVRYKPDWPEAHFRLGVMSYVLGKKSQSADEHKKLRQMSSPLANVLYRIINSDSAPSTQNKSSADPNALISTAASPVSTDSSQTPRSETTSGNVQSGSSKPSSSTVGSSASPTGIASRAADSTSATTAPALTEIYRVGIGDILDVRFLNSASAGRSTLFTVVAGGMIDFPVAGGPILVAGLTTDEIQARIAAELKRRAVEDKAQISVGVRQYVSHTVLVTGLVAGPGARVLRREAVPLYVVLAESQLRNDAGRIVIMRAGSTGQSLDLNDPQTLNKTIVNGDVITVTGRPQEFYYIAGRINYPGQKTFQSGITLLQAILAAGGTPRQNENIVEISREGTDGRLVTTRFNLKQIKSGAVEDPKLQPGDRIQVVR